MPTICPKCHQRIATSRLGVRMPPLKARIFDTIEAAGDVGITSQQVADSVYRWRNWNERGPVSVALIRTHVGQINNLLVGTTGVIVSDPRSGPFARWHLRPRRPRQEAAE